MAEYPVYKIKWQLPSKIFFVSPIRIQMSLLIGDWSGKIELNLIIMLKFPSSNFFSKKPKTLNLFLNPCFQLMKGRRHPTLAFVTQSPTGT